MAPPQLPDDILQEITEHLSLNVRTLCSCALACRALARHCQARIFRRVDLRSPKSKPRFIKLRGVLEKTPSLADHTRELRLFPSRRDQDVENESEGYAQFLSCFKRLEKVSLSRWGFRGDNALSKALKRVFELETLRSLTLSGPSGEPEPDQSSATPALQVQNNYQSVHNRVPLFLSLCNLQLIQAFARLAREQRGIFKSHWIEELDLILPFNEPLSPMCRACCELLKAVEVTQRGSNGAESFSRFNLNVGGPDFPYESFGSALPPSTKTLSLSYIQDESEAWELSACARVLEQFLKNFAGSRPPLREMKLRFSIRLESLPIFITIPDPVLEVDRLLSSQDLFPSFQKFRFAPVQIISIPSSLPRDRDPQTLKEDFEKEIRRWFPSLSETGRTVVEWKW